MFIKASLQFPVLLQIYGRNVELNMLLRNGASRLALRSLAAAPTGARTAAGAASFTRTTTTAPCLQWTTQFGSLAARRRPQLTQQLKSTTPSAILRRSLADKKLSEGQKQAESRYAREEIKPTPETVSSTSSTHPMFSEVGAETPQNEVDMMAGMKHDVVRVYHPVFSNGL